MLKLKTKDQGIFFSSDFHWSHANICRGTSTWKSFEDGSSHQSVRDFDTVEEMNAAILKGINDKVGPDDILFFLGDWSFKNIDQIWDLRKQINCKNIHFIFGNHDEKIEADRLYTIPSEDVEKHEDLVLAANAFEYQTGSTISGTVAYLQNLFTSVGYYNEISIDGQRICMSHYAMRVWNKSHHGSWMLYAHSHSTLEGTPWGKSMDVGIDNYFRLNGEYKPFSFQEIRTIMNTRDVAIVDHHNSETN